MKAVLRISVLALFCVPAALFGTVAHAAPPTGFQNQLITSSLTQPTDITFLPDGRMLITQKTGSVLVYKNGSILPTPALTLSSLSTGGDRGLLSVTIDGNFSNDHYVYLAYTTNGNHERISRFTLNADILDPASELIMLENPSTWNGFLDAVSIRYNSVDNKLYATFGSDGLSSNSQDLSTLDGKLLRINLDGTIPTDNPFVNVQGAQGAIWSYGFRNPWRMNIDTNGTALIGDVGENTWEKVVRSAKGANFGWPMFEGDCGTSCGGVTRPLFVYNHNGAGAAIVGGDIYKGTSFPSTYQHQYFYGDYVNGYINYLTLDSGGNAIASTTFDSGLGALSSINSAPDGCLYYTTIFPGSLHRYCYGNVQPVLNALITSSAPYGPTPLMVQFSGSNSSDSSGTALNYNWNFGDGTTGTGATPSHTYTQKGVYTATLVVSNADGSATTTAKIYAGYLPPSPTIITPISGSKYSDGDVINFSGSATDPQDGAIAPANLTWVITFHHNTHIHPPTTFSGVASGSFTVPVADEPSPVTWYEIDLTAKNSIGLSSTTITYIYPNVTAVNYVSNPTGAQLLLDSQPITTPYTDLSVAGFQHTLSVNSPQTIGTTSYTFSGWSNGGAQTQTFTTPLATTTITASFTTGGTVSQNIITSAKTDAPTYAPGQSLFITASTTDTANLTNALVDIELWGASGKVAQKTTTGNFVAGQPFSVSWNTVAPTSPGAYTIKIGVFSSDWATLYTWNDNADTFTVTSGTGSTTAPLTISLTANTTSQSYTPGSNVQITTTATPNEPSQANLILDTEVWNGTQKLLQNVTPLNLANGTATSSVWSVAAPSVAGTYTIKTGAFSSDWNTLYQWNNSAATFAVTGSATTTATYADTVSLNPGTPAPSSPETITTSITSNQTNPNLLLDTELSNAGGQVLQNVVVPFSVTANQTATSAWPFTTPATAGSYKVKVGLFSPDWNTLYLWDNNAGTLQVGSSTPIVIPGFVASASAQGNSFPPGSQATITTNVTATGDLPNVIIDTEVFDANGVQVLQHDVPTNLVANQLFTTAWTPTLPTTTGIYTIKIGIFAGDWSKVYFWQNRASQFSVGTPPGSPQPGVIYPVTILTPANNSTATGTVEFQAVINGLDINSYNMSWETGGGSLKNLDTDPVTLAYKHAWINFDTWNWMPNHQYPITIIATDFNNNVIGSSTITVIH